VLVLRSSPTDEAPAAVEFLRRTDGAIADVLPLAGEGSPGPPARWTARHGAVVAQWPEALLIYDCLDARREGEQR
jgi:hypothetical protein